MEFDLNCLNLMNKLDVYCQTSEVIKGRKRSQVKINLSINEVKSGYFVDLSQVDTISIALEKESNSSNSTNTNNL